jgi:hypothetical protein
MLLLGLVLPCRADTTAVTGTVLLASARGVGYRRIAADIGRPLSTVRRWLRSVRGSHTQRLRTQGVVRIPPSTARCNPAALATRPEAAPRL